MVTNSEHKKISFWRDEHGKVAVWQTPNVPLIGWAVSAILCRLLPVGAWKQALLYISFGLLFTWAWLELTSGKSYFRRLLGLAILILIIYDRARV